MKVEDIEKVLFLLLFLFTLDIKFSIIKYVNFVCGCLNKGAQNYEKN